ncbi:hypothetical protein [Candidatus Tisiphia endosymbiont of Hybos culiciformis]
MCKHDEAILFCVNLAKAGISRFPPLLRMTTYNYRIVTKAAPRNDV